MDELEAFLDDVWREGRATWPGVELAREVFAAFVRERLPDRAESARQLAVTDLYLACACARGDAAAIAAFESACLSVADPALVKLGAAADTIAEVKQRLRASLLVGEDGPPKILQFSGRGELRGWVRVIAVNEALGLARRAGRQQPLDDDALVRSLCPDDDPELAHLKTLYRAEFRRAFQDALAALERSERLLLRQQFLDGLGIDELATLYRVHRATAARRLERARQRLQERTLELLGERLAVEGEELDSILRLVRSQLDVSLSQLLPEPA